MGKLGPVYIGSFLVGALFVLAYHMWKVKKGAVSS